MIKQWLVGLGLLAVAGLLATGQPPEREGKKGPPDGGKRGPEGGPPRFQLGKVLPPFVLEELDLTEEQQKALDALEKDVRVRLGKILTERQRRQIENMRPPKGPGGPGRPPRDDDDGPPPPPRDKGDRPPPRREKGDRPPPRDDDDGPPPPPRRDRGDRPPPRDKGDRLPPPRDEDDSARREQPAGAVQWFATLERGLAEAKRSGRPILFVSAAPHCGGISGIW